MPEAERAVVVEALVEVVAADLAEVRLVAIVAVRSEETVEASVVSTRDSKM